MTSTSVFKHQGGQRYARSGDKFHCEHCRAFVFELQVDVHAGETFKVAQVCQDKGQAPFQSGEKFKCKNCHEYLWPNTMLRNI